MGGIRDFAALMFMGWRSNWYGGCCICLRMGCLVEVMQLLLIGCWSIELYVIRML